MFVKEKFLSFIIAHTLPIYCFYILEDSKNYMPPILVSSSAKRIAGQILVIEKLNGWKILI